MSFFPRGQSDQSVFGGEVLGKLGCLACPLNLVKGNQNSRMAASGHINANGIYILGEAPDIEADAAGTPFAGSAGALLRAVLARCATSGVPVRYNNIIRTRPPKDQAPKSVAISCCRPSVVKDIEDTKPAGIILCGEAALKWATELTGITTWRGRRLPVKIGNYRCWVYPVTNPNTLSRSVKSKKIDNAFFERDMVSAVKDIIAQTPLVEEFDVAQFDASYRVQIEDILDTPGAVAFDIETHAADREKDPIRPYGDGNQVLSIAFASEHGSIALSFAHPGHLQDDPTILPEKILGYLEASPATALVAHNLSFDLEWLLERFFTPEQGERFLRLNRHRLECTMAQAYVLDNRPKAHSLNLLCYQYFGVRLKMLTPIDIARLIDEPVEKVLRYNAIDAFFTHKLYESQQRRIVAAGMQQVAAEQYRRVPTLVAASKIGLLIDRPESLRQKSEVSENIARIEASIKEMPAVLEWERSHHSGFDLSNNACLVSFFSQFAELPRTDRGNVSVAAGALSEIDHPVAREISKHRELSTLYNTFIKTIAPGGKHLWSDGKLHPQYNPCRTATRRLSSSSPNGQNFPKRKNEGVRNQIIAPPGYKLVSCDFGQIEARIIAADSQDAVFVNAILGGLDIHEDWAARIFQAYPQWQITDPKERRNRAKGGMVFASFYLASAQTVATSCGIPLSIADSLLREFWKVFSGVKEWHLKLISDYHQFGYLELCTGFRCRGVFTDFQIVNYRVQGSASDLVVGAMNRLSERGVQACLNIHDDLIFLVPEDSLDGWIADITAEMMIPPAFMQQVPLAVETSIGDRWGSMYEQAVN